MTGKLLLAMPSMGDNRFDKAVIYVCIHDEQGAMGLVINHAVPGLEFGSLLKELKIAGDLTIPSDIIKRPVMNGGPVETSRGFLLHSQDFTHNDSVSVNKGLSITGTLDALELVAAGQGPDNMLFTLGYSGWSAGQLDEELQANAWLICDASHDLIFTDAPSSMWDQAIGTLGFDPALLSVESGRA